MKTHSKIVYAAFFYLLFLLLFLLIYAPVIHGHYFYGEEYRFQWTCNSIWDCQCDTPIKYTLNSFYPEMQFEGRLLYPVYMYLIFNKYINELKSVDAAGAVRFIGVVILGLLAYVLFYTMKSNRFKTTHAFLLSIIICTLPPFQVYVGRLNNVGVFIPGALMAIIASLIMFKVVFAEGRRKTGHMALAVFISVILLIIAMCTYQPVALTYWALALIPITMLVDEDVRNKRISFIIYIITGFIAMITYFVLIKVIMRYMLDDRFYPSFNKGVLIGIGDIYQKIIWFIKYPFYTALNLWNIFPNKEIALLVSIILSSGILSSFACVVLQMNQKRKGFKLLYVLMFRYLLILIVVPLSVVSHLAITQNIEVMVPKHSVIIGLQISIVLLCYWGLINIAELFKTIFNFSIDLQKKIITFGLIILAVGAAFLANYNVNKYFATLQKDELIYVKDAIQEYGVPNLSKTPRIFYINPDSDPRMFYSEFIHLSSWGFMIPMSRLALYELGINPNTVTINGIRQMRPEDKNVLIIDMRDFQKKEYKKLNIPPNLPEIVKPLF